MLYPLHSHDQLVSAVTSITEASRITQYSGLTPNLLPNLTRLKNEATTLRNGQEFSRGQLTELAATDYQSWAKESFQIATAITYQNGAFTGNPKGHRRDCREVVDAKLLPDGYARTAGRIAHRRITLAGYRLADLVKRLTTS